MIFLGIKKRFYQDIENYLWDLSCLFSCLFRLGRNSHIKITWRLFMIWARIFHGRDFYHWEEPYHHRWRITIIFSRVLDVANHLLTRHSPYSAPWMNDNAFFLWNMKPESSFAKGFSGPKSFRDFRETGPWTLAGIVLDSPCLQITYWVIVFQWFRSTRVPLLSTNRYANTRASGFAFGSGRSLWSLCYCPWFALITRGSCWPSSSRCSRGTGIALDKRCCTWDPGFTLFSLLATEILSLSWEWKAKNIL